ncbi:lysyl-tRNA synthetase class 2 [Halospina denitrificans]|uniref:Lysyl-tRNA synthetase class 2 n=1 Tax=Halospina denitrificans TaxID=332522 RepID=A0A4R7K1G1_9GAMM|nr:EF-P lysine aminoacylase EpmA [Halospina denitrificans]TDT43309.1 lysyl-tRNA synthetase class 2 [Halospina denitrificans]
MSWQPGASLSMLRARARLRQQVRDFFAERGVLEVDTPVLGRYGVSEPAIDSIAASAPGLDGVLQTSPEYFMKRLLAAGSGSIYQMGSVFRAGESGHRHNPEFTMLEWYRPGFSIEALMEEVAALVRVVLEIGSPVIHDYRDLLRSHAGVDPWMDDDAILRSRASEVSGIPADALDRGEALDLLLSHQVEPILAGEEAVFVRGYPPDQAALAQVVREGDIEVAQRFELYVRGVELCNGYRELTDAGEQRARFERDNQIRRRQGKPEMAPDPGLLAALEAGLPPCSGVALGLDRLLMLQTGAASLDEVLPFSVDRL